MSLPIPWCLCGLQQDCSRNLGVNHPWHHPRFPVYTPISNWAPGPLISNFPNRSNICHPVTSFNVTRNTNLSRCFHSFPRSRLLLCLKRPVAPHCTYNKGPNAHRRSNLSYLSEFQPYEPAFSEFLTGTRLPPTTGPFQRLILLNRTFLFPARLPPKLLLILQISVYGPFPQYHPESTETRLGLPIVVSQGTTVPPLRWLQHSCNVTSICVIFTLSSPHGTSL